MKKEPISGGTDEEKENGEKGLQETSKDEHLSTDMDEVVFVFADRWYRKKGNGEDRYSGH